MKEGVSFLHHVEELFACPAEAFITARSNKFPVSAQLMIFKPSLSVYQDMKKVLLQADYRNRRGWFQSYDCGLGWNGFSERRTEEEDAVRDASRARGRLGDELEEEEEEEPQQGTVLQKPLKDPSIYTRRRGRHEEDSKQPYIHDFHQPECGYTRYLFNRVLFDI